MVSMPYFLIIEFLGPVVELTGYLIMIVSLLFGGVYLEFAILLFLLSIFYGSILSMSAVLLEEWTIRKYPKASDITKLFFYSLTETLWYRPLTVLWRCEGIIDFLRKKRAGVKWREKEYPNEQRETIWLPDLHLGNRPASDLPFWVWQVKGKKDLDLTIVDKTVPDESYREHKGLMWLLNQQKYRQSDGSSYREDTDYIGYDPKEGKPTSVPESAEGYDAVYITDTYGVYEEDLDTENVSGSRSSKVYGGLEEEEIDSLKTMALNEGKTIIAEFNSMADPTDEKVRRKFYSFSILNGQGGSGVISPI